MFRVSLGEYEVSCGTDGLPIIHDRYEREAKLAERFGEEDRDTRATCFCAVAHRGEAWPYLTITQRYSPDFTVGFYPGLLLVPETHVLFLGAGRRLLAYDLSAPSRLWEDEADSGFWFWSRYGGFVLMAAELELAAWTVSGRKLWSRFVEPPWSYQVERSSVVVKVEGWQITCLSLAEGRPI